MSENNKEQECRQTIIDYRSKHPCCLYCRYYTYNLTYELNHYNKHSK